MINCFDFSNFCKPSTNITSSSDLKKQILKLKIRKKTETRTRCRWSWVCPKTVFKSSIRVITPIDISLRSWGESGHGYIVARKLKKKFFLTFKFYLKLYPSQIFFTLLFNWSPWKKMIKTAFWTSSPVIVSLKGSVISACRKNTLPLQARQRRRSKAGRRSRWITPATNLINKKIN